MTTHRSLRPASDEFAPFYAPYIAKVPDGDILASLAHGSEEVADLFGGVSEEVAGSAYAEGKWTLKEVLQHCADAERIFAYRALRIARGDGTELPGWDEQAYMGPAGVGRRTLPSLMAELGTVRHATVSLFDGLPEEAWARRGIANRSEVSVRGIAWITAGHLIHHLNIVRERYLGG
jgi:hypothetical protein